MEDAKAQVGPVAWRWKYDDEGLWRVQDHEPKFSLSMRNITVQPLFAAPQVAAVPNDVVRIADDMQYRAHERADDFPQGGFECGYVAACNDIEAALASTAHPTESN